jgi:porin
MKNIFQIKIATGILFLCGQSFADDALDSLMKKYGNQNAAPPSVTKPVEAAPLKTEKIEIVPPKVAIKKSASKSYSIQIASYKVEEDAKTSVSNLTKLGYQASFREVRVKNEKQYRVHIGNFESRSAAKSYLDENIKGRLKKSAVITKISKQQKNKMPSPAPLTIAQLTSPRKIAEVNTESDEKRQIQVDKKQESVPEKEEVKEENEALFGNWGGLKSFLGDHGIAIQLKYKGDATQNQTGGLEKKSTFLGNVDLNTEFDLEKIAGLKGLNLVLYGLGNHGGHPTEFVGDSFGTSNIEAPSTIKLYEAYFVKTIDDRFTLLFGLRDLNVDYYATESAGNLLNSAFGIGPSFSQTGVNGPSIFPSAAPAITFKYESPNSYYFQSGIFNATAGDPNHPNGTHIPTVVKDGYLYAWETGFAGGKEAGKYKYSIGLWSYSKEAEALDTSKSAGQNSGGYILFDRNLTQNISVFLKHGLAAPEFNQFSSSTEVGATFQGLVPGRSDDVLSIGYASAEVSDDYQSLNDSKSTESATEISYRMSFDRGLAVTPDFQYVKNTGVTKGVQDAQVGSIRIEINF